MELPVFRPFKNNDIQNFTPLLCDGYVVNGATSMQAFLAGFHEASAAHPTHKLLATLDNLGQAFYTSGHAIELHKFDQTDGHDLSEIDPAALMDGEHLGYLTTASEFGIRRSNVLSKAEHISFAGLAAKLFWKNDDPEGPDFFELNSNPVDALDPEMLVQIVPVGAACEMICAFPNGYFASDLTPFENYALSRHLEEGYGYALFGIGASYIGFLKTRALDDAEHTALTSDLVALFKDAEGGDFAARIRQATEQPPWLFLRYVSD